MDIIFVNAYYRSTTITLLYLNIAISLT